MENTVYFANAEPIDLSAIAVMGVSVKTGANPIGYFGTGLKFALATLLRTGHDVVLRRGEEVIRFTAEPEVIRGEEFQRVKMGGEKLGFTTALGRNWEVWQAYRELHCNATDEGGVIGDSLPPGEWGTIFEVRGQEVSNCHRDRRKTFLEGRPLTATQECEVHPRIEGGTVFYRGVRAHRHPGVMLYTYNVLAGLTLTEDRTIRDAYMVSHYAADAIRSCDDEELIFNALLADRGTFEFDLSFEHQDKPSLAFMDVVFRLRHDHKCNRSAIKLWEKHSDVRLSFSEVQLDQFDEEQITAAFLLLRRLSCEMTRQDFIVVESLGEGVFGSARFGQIMISRATLDLGVRFIASTLYEEWLHKAHNFEDESRRLQNLLFEKLMAMTERCAALEARRT